LVARQIGLPQFPVPGVIQIAAKIFCRSTKTAGADFETGDVLTKVVDATNNDVLTVLKDAMN
jgi:hypothetical protein